MVHGRGVRADGACVVIATAFSLIVLIFVVGLFRQLLAIQFAMRANNILRDYLVTEANAGRAQITRIDELYSRLESETGAVLAFNLRVWTTRQAFPWLFELVDQQRVAS